MRIVEIKSLDNGAHNNQTSSAVIPVPDGWAVIRDDEKCENFPFGSFEVEEVDGVPYMKKDSWIPGVMPEPDPEAEQEPTTEEILYAMLGVSRYE